MFEIEVSEQIYRNRNSGIQLQWGNWENLNYEKIRDMIKIGLNPEEIFSSGATPAHLLAAYGNPKNHVILALIEPGSKSYLARISDTKGQTPIHYVMKRGDDGLILLNDLMIHGNGDINKQDKKGNTALHLLAQTNQSVKLLNHMDWVSKPINNGNIHSHLNTNIKNYNGHTALHCAYLRKNPSMEFIETLIEISGINKYNKQSSIWAKPILENERKKWWVEVFGKDHLKYYS